MNYDFPVINNYSDVEQYIDDCFIVKEKNGVRFVNYKNMSPETFPPVVDYGTAVRREFRGIAFDVETGVVLSRPFHKFFNMNERPETEDIDFDAEHWIEEKLDGSMIRPILHPSGAIRWCTKAGVTDVGLQAEVFVANNPELVTFAERVMSDGFTPIFEYVGPNNKIVLDYEEEKLILLSVRSNTTGKYYHPQSFVHLAELLRVPTVKRAEMPKGDDENTEGVVIGFSSGHKVKVKTEWYVLRHRGKELIQNERKVVGMILDNTLDDVLPLVSHEQRTQLQRFERNVLYDIQENASVLSTTWKYVGDNYSTKKDYALSQTKGFDWWARFMFMKYDDKPIEADDYVREVITKSLGTQKKYEDVKQKLKLPDLKES